MHHIIPLLAVIHAVPPYSHRYVDDLWHQPPISEHRSSQSNSSNMIVLSFDRRHPLFIKKKTAIS